MKVFALVILTIALVSSAPIDSDKDAVIVKYENDNIGIDGYNFAFETSNGISRSEIAEIKNVGTDQESLVVRGTISWVGADGQTYQTDFVADENGFQPTGAHLV